ncbi:MAG: SO_0444 family Cu/Zn efflux transporter [Candidatus Lernaella stagnicola]|nr:SO_0444 family Cu/Zn efflux transporter [Candidatus Lernaella stagnicola]
MSGTWIYIIETLRMVYVVFVQTAPFLLLGLFLAGWSKIAIRTKGVHRYLGGGNLRSAFYAAVFGLPLPICSCGVVPVSLSVRDKGASREANLSFLISTPETSVDTLVITWGLLGPLMTIVRPIAALLTAMFAAVLSIAGRTDRPDDHDGEVVLPDAEACEIDEDAHVHEGGYHVVGFRGLWKSLAAAFVGLYRRSNAEGPDVEPVDEAAPDFDPEHNHHHDPVPLRVLVRDANRYAFREMMDDISVWFVLGIILAGVIAAVVPNSWIANIPGGQLGSMLFVLVLSVPMYVCAVESTPIAAMLILKGLSPGAALVFLLAGPATNAATLLIINQAYGRRFLRIYLTAISLVAILSGMALNTLLSWTGWQITSRVAETGAFSLWTVISALSALLLLVLLGLSFYRLDWPTKWVSFKSTGTRIIEVINLFLPIRSPAGVIAPRRRRNRWAVIVALVAAYGLSGFYTVGPGDAGYKLRLGKLVAADIDAGLHYRLPWPFERVEIYRVHETRKTDLGFRTDAAQILRWRDSPPVVSDTGWHSFFTTMNAKPEEGMYLIGDENNLEAKFTIHFRIANPTAFFFDYAKNRDLIALGAESVLRERLASEQIDGVLAGRIKSVADDAALAIQQLLDRYGIGIEVLGVYPVDLHPPVAAVAAFRDVASAMEDRETLIHQAYGAREKALPKARGDAAKRLATASAFAIEVVADSTGRADSFRARATQYARYRAATRWRLFIEAMETSLARRQKILIPSDTATRTKLRVWSGDTRGMTGLLQTGAD